MDTCFCRPPLMPVLGISRLFLTSFHFHHFVQKFIIVHGQQLVYQLVTPKEAYVCMPFSAESWKMCRWIKMWCCLFGLCLNWVYSLSCLSMHMQFSIKSNELILRGLTVTGRKAWEQGCSWVSDAGHAHRSKATKLTMHDAYRSNTKHLDNKTQ